MTTDQPSLADPDLLSTNPVLRLSAVLRGWRDQLVSFDGRNRQLYYRKLKSGDVDFAEDNIDRIAVDKLLSGGTVKVSALYEPVFSKIKSKETIDLSIEANIDDENEAKDQDAPSAVQWGRILRRYETVYRKARENYDEKNIETCFLADGFVSWENKKAGPTPNAPLILHPIKIEPTARGNSDFKLSKIGESFFNQALILFLQKEYGIGAEAFTSIESATWDSPVTKNLLDKLVISIPGFSFTNIQILGNFSFLKYPMVQDLNRIIELDTMHEVLGAISGDRVSAERLEATGKEMSLEALSELSPILENLIFPTDSSQHSAISAVLGGKSIVIQGPPGSGKSQTIVNLIAECVMANKKVLFVAEKRAAIDAVTERLVERGLGGIVLDLHGEPEKKTIAQNLLAAVKNFELPLQISHNEEISLLQSKLRLNSRWKWFNEPSGVEGTGLSQLTNYEVLHELGRVRSNLPKKVILQANLYSTIGETLTFSQKDNYSKIFSSLHLHGYFTERYQSNSVISEFREFTNSESAQSIVRHLDQVQASLEAPYLKKIQHLLDSAFKIKSDSFSGFKRAMDAVQEHIKFTKIFRVQDLPELASLSEALLPLKEFRKQRSLGLFKGYRVRKREVESLRKILLSSDALSDRELYDLIHDEMALLLKWTDRMYVPLELNALSLEYEEIRQFIDKIVLLIDELMILLPMQGTNREVTFAEIRMLLEKYLPVRDLILVAPVINRDLQALAKANLSSVLEAMLDFQLTPEDSDSFWNLIWLSGHLNSQLKKASWSSSVEPLELESVNFKNLDTKHLRSNTGRLLSHLTSVFQGLPSSDKQLLVKESMKKSGHLPFRELLTRIPESILKIKPVMAMSPLAVSQLLPTKESMFDIVIFDEASQIRPEDAITSIFRGKQLVVAGDRFQLPPTSVGEKSLEEDVTDWSVTDESYSEPATIGMESILTTAISVFNLERNVKPLRLHYRSNDERLISWSNFHIYKKAGEELFTFPALNFESNESLRYTYLPGVRTQSMSVPNEAEIQEVKKLVLKHIETTPSLSLGVIAFGLRHSIRLQDEFNILENENDQFYQWKKDWSEKREKFFIKNIERVQGDERDAIIITPGYAPNLDGNVPLQFGSLNRQGGERRLNVAASRAKEYMHLVTSIRSQDIDTARSKAVSVALLRTYLDFMENGGRLVDGDYQFNVPTTPFEEEILQKLSDNGLTIDCQVGDSGFKIDFAVRDPKTNKYVLAIEADGASYHSSEYARERDYMRQRILVNRGWQFVRIWSTDWWQNPDREVERVMTALQPKLRNSIDDERALIPPPSPRSEKYEEIEEFKILRGLKAQNPRLAREQLFDLWCNTMGVQRRTQQLINRFSNYWRDLR